MCGGGRKKRWLGRVRVYQEAVGAVNAIALVPPAAEACRRILSEKTNKQTCVHVPYFLCVCARDFFRGAEGAVFCDYGSTHLFGLLLTTSVRNNNTRVAQTKSFQH